MAEVLLPPERIPLEGKPVIFLAGPIQGTENWQQKAAERLHHMAPHIIIANPRREYLDRKFIYEEQVDWEIEHLRKAGEQGVVMFWLAKETERNSERAYAQTSRFELAEWKLRHERDRTKLVVGIEKGFSGARYIRRRFAQDSPDIQIWDSLTETCYDAIGQFEFSEFVNFGDLVHRQGLGQTQYASQYLTGLGRPFLGEDLRYVDFPLNHHSIRIHPDDFETFAKRLQALRE